MSFILDALKKSEAERQRQTGPTLLELRVTQPRRRYPGWAIIVGILLGLNVVVLLLFLLHRPVPAAPIATTAPAASESASGNETAPDSASGSSVPSAAQTTAAREPAQTPASHPTAATLVTAPAAPGTPPGAGLAEGSAPAAQVATLAAQAASLAAQAAAVAAQVRSPAPTPGTVAPLVGGAGAPAAVTAADGAGGQNASNGSFASDGVAGNAGSSNVTVNPADELPALPAAAGKVTMATQNSSDYSGWPTLSELGGNVPSLQLNLLGYSDQPNNRYALINMHHVREGDTTSEGVRVLAITRQGVALDYHGQHFMLRPAGTVP